MTKYNYLIPWSGGLDSTSLINKLLNEGHTVHALYNNLNELEQDKRQLNAVRKMRDIYFSKFQFSLLENHIVGLARGTGRLILGQVPSHIFSVIQYMDGYDYVALAYVMNDDAISFIDDIKNIYYSYEPLFNGKLPQLVFPYSKTKKENLYDSLPQILKDHITFCEGFDIKDNCGVCSSCKRMLHITPERFK